jgi:hypothetical protein
VEDLEDEVAGLSTRSEKLKSELEVIEDLIKGKKNSIDDQRGYQKIHTNNKKLFVTIEIQPLTKEVEFQELEIQLAEKQMKEMKAYRTQERGYISI